MKRLLVFLWIFVLLCGFTFAAGKPEAAAGEGEPIKLYVANLNLNRPEAPMHDMIIRPFVAKYPNVEIVSIPISTTDASTVSMDSRLAAGLPVHFYNDYYSRAGKYADPKKYNPLDLAVYWPASEIDDFIPELLAPYLVDGSLYCAPWYQMIIGSHINLSLLEKAGYELPPPEDWTIAAFMEMAEAVKKADLADNIWPTMMFAENRSGDWHYMLWFASFGTKLFTDGDYSRTTVNSPAGLATMTFWKDLQVQGYIPREAAIMNDDHLIAARGFGQLALAGARLGNYNNRAGQQKLIDQGAISEFFTSTFYPFPRAPGVDTVPLLTSYNLHVAFDSGDEEINRLAAEFTWWVNNTRSQEMILSPPSAWQLPSRKSVVVEKTGPGAEIYAAAVVFAQENGYYDVGGALTVYNEIRGALFPQLQLMFDDARIRLEKGEPKVLVTPQIALDLYEDAINAALATLED